MRFASEYCSQVYLIVSCRTISGTLEIQTYIRMCSCVLASHIIAIVPLRSCIVHMLAHTLRLTLYTIEQIKCEGSQLYLLFILLLVCHHLVCCFLFVFRLHLARIGENLFRRRAERAVYQIFALHRDTNTCTLQTRTHTNMWCVRSHCWLHI